MEPSAPLLDYLASAQARDAGMDKVESNNREWLRLALIELGQLSRGSLDWANLDNGFSGEDLRLILTPLIGKPTTPHAWGSLCMHAVRKKIIVATGRYVPMQDVKAHARKTPQYQFVSRDTQ